MSKPNTKKPVKSYLHFDGKKIEHANTNEKQFVLHFEFSFKH